MMKIGILGAGGALGRKTLQVVLDRGTPPGDVVAIARRPSKLQAWADRGVDVRSGDYDQTEALEAAFQGLERLLLVPSGVMPAHRVQQYDNAIGAAEAAGVRHLLHYGLLGVDVTSPFVIAPFLLYAEAALRTCGLEWTILRNGLYADPIVEWVPSILEMGTIPYPTGDGRCSFVSRGDIARAGAAALTTDGHAGRTYNLTGPQALSTADLCAAVARISGRPVEYRPASDSDFTACCRAEGVPEVFTQVLLTLYWAVREGLYDVVSNDIEALTGRPPDSFEQYLSQHLPG